MSSKRAASVVRAPTSGPSCGTSSAPLRGSIASRSMPTSRASASTATPSATTPRSAAPSPIASQPSVLGSLRGSSGSTAKAAASSAARATEAREIRPRAPKQAHGAPPRPLASATACAPQNSASSSAAA